MRHFHFCIGDQEFAVTEVSHVNYGGRKTEVEIREDHGNYYQQFRNGYIPRNASEEAVRRWVRENYVEDEDWDGMPDR